MHDSRPERGKKSRDESRLCRLDSLRHRFRYPSSRRHRGPDGAGAYSDHRCALAQTRLALIGPASLPLPVRSPDGRYVIVYNGEVYNLAELSRELQAGAPFALHTDTEVVLAAYILLGAGR